MSFNNTKYCQEIEQYEREGYVFPVKGLFSPTRLNDVDSLLSKLVENRPSGLPSEDLLNLHLTCKEVFELCKEPSCLYIASKLLKTSDLSIFTSRILCKMPFQGKEIKWHQDSLYWPLEPPDKYGKGTSLIECDQLAQFSNRFILIKIMISYE